MEEKEVKGYVKKRYSKIAQTGESCSPSCGCILSAADVALGIGYSEEDLKSIPEASSMGLGLGLNFNPTNQPRNDDGRRDHGTTNDDQRLRDDL